MSGVIDPTKCMTCGRHHETRPFLEVVTDRHRALYSASRWQAPSPPVTTNGWNVDSWCRWIDAHGEWLE